MKKVWFLSVFLVLFFVICRAFASVPAISMSEYEGVYHFILDGKKISDKIHFVSSEELISNRKAHDDFDSIFTINAGFFDPKNKKTISYVVENYGEKILSPLENENLLSNPVLMENMKKIENRTEFRVLKCGNETKYEIVPHNNLVEDGCRIRTSCQGGPMILPELRMESEFFIAKDENGNVIRESASVLRRCARTIIGLKGEEIHVLIFTNKSPLNLYEVKEYCENLGLDRVMAFDGGSSTSLNFKDIEVVSAKNSGRLLKSFLIIKK